MKKIIPRKSAFSISRLLACLLCLISLFLALIAISGPFGTRSLAQGAGNPDSSSVWVGASYHNDVSPPLRDMPASSDTTSDTVASRKRMKIPRYHIGT